MTRRRKAVGIEVGPVSYVDTACTLLVRDLPKRAWLDNAFCAVVVFWTVATLGLSWIRKCFFGARCLNSDAINHTLMIDWAEHALGRRLVVRYLLAKHSTYCCAHALQALSVASLFLSKTQTLLRFSVPSPHGIGAEPTPIELVCGPGVKHVADPSGDHVGNAHDS
ncbi:putative transmembrane protein [Toxoplasma gondii GAB2-2007-GAL-DOM2]|uniref:Putative transmembrane protein n=1 Tax=Toxoplasma gondii GAB2-2007-GAL-DOM2 TaxID=1130820 RepID=A0A086JTT2_TOXGO|nr:putative transmembrane protein [Toxoplasma gondii GAB2-2007-GAL-DOM2]